MYVYEHAFTPAGLVEEPVWIMSVFHIGKLLGRFGFWHLEEEEIEDAATFRTCHLLGVSFLSEELNNCFVAISNGDTVLTYRYDPDGLAFRKI